jgi:hypothetical protein
VWVSLDASGDRNVRVVDGLWLRLKVHFFLYVQKNVFEKISYPWFENLKIDSPHFVDYDFEDVSLFKKFAKKDIFVYVDTETLIGHDKVSTIRL